MPQRDTQHAAVRKALETDGWTITDDPLVLSVGAHNLYVDLGAERLIAAERGAERIAIEIKSFVGRSEVADLELALGQFLIYRSLLRRQEPDRALVLAVSNVVFEALLSTDLGHTVREDYALALMVFDPVREEITQWLR